MRHCHICKTDQPGDESFCSRCGYPLLPSTSSAEPVRSGQRIFILCSGLFALLLVVVLAVASLNTGASTAPESDEPLRQDAIVRTDCYCAPDDADVLLAYAALGRSDKDAVIGLVARGRVMELKYGTRVREYLRQGKLSRVYVLGGFHLQQRCWIPTSLLY